MATSTNRQIARDAQGFLLHSEQWTEELAEETACGDDLRLTERHWQVIRSMRKAYVRNGTAPWVRMLCKVSGVPVRELYRLFPTGPSRRVAKIAGIPKQRACI